MEETSSVTGSSLWVDRLKRDEKMMALDQNGIPPDNRQAFFAFPGEGRSCPGSKFAEQEAVLALGTLLRDLRKYRAMSCDQLKEGLVQRPIGGMPMRVERRTLHVDARKRVGDSVVGKALIT